MCVGVWERDRGGSWILSTAENIRSRLSRLSEPCFHTYKWLGVNFTAFRLFSSKTPWHIPDTLQHSYPCCSYPHHNGIITKYNSNNSIIMQSSTLQKCTIKNIMLPLNTNVDPLMFSWWLSSCRRRRERRLDDEAPESRTCVVTPGPIALFVTRAFAAAGPGLCTGYQFTTTSQRC